jgi:hypothetical protein
MLNELAVTDRSINFKLYPFIFWGNDHTIDKYLLLSVWKLTARIYLNLGNLVWPLDGQVH